MFKPLLPIALLLSIGCAEPPSKGEPPAPTRPATQPEPTRPEPTKAEATKPEPTKGAKAEPFPSWDDGDLKIAVEEAFLDPKRLYLYVRVTNRSKTLILEPGPWAKALAASQVADDVGNHYRQQRSTGFYSLYPGKDTQFALATDRPVEAAKAMTFTFLHPSTKKPVEFKIDLIGLPVK